MTLSIDSVVEVRAQIAPQGVLRREFGRTLFLYPGAESTDLGVIAANRARDLRVNAYSGVAGVAGDYAATHAARQAASIHFQQQPYPRDFLTAGWFAAGAATYLVGAERSGATALTTIKGLGATSLPIAGQEVSVDLNVTGTGATGYGNVASALQTAIRMIANPDLSGAVVSYADNHFVVRILNGADLGGVSSGTAAEGLGLAEGAAYHRGTPAETQAEALDRIAAANAGFYFLTVSPDIYTDPAHALAVAKWASGNGVQLLIDSVDTGALTPNESTSIPAQLSALEYDRTSVVWSRAGDHKAVSLAGRLSTVNFDGQNTLITAKFKSLPGTLADELTTAQKAEIDRKRLNHYSPFGGDNILAEGWTLKPGTWIDVRYWLDWFVNAVQTEVYNLLRTSPTRVPQTTLGLSSIQGAVERACVAGRRNGGIAPGRISELLANDIRIATGNREFDGFLTRGYLVSVGPLEEQSQSDRNERRAPPTKVWLKGSGAIHSADIELIFEN